MSDSNKTVPLSPMSSSVSKVTKSVKKITGFDDEPPTWEELKDVERRRRTVLRRTDLPFYRILTFWDGTVLQVLATDPLMWFTMLLYVGIRFQARYGLPDYVADIASGDIGVIGGFLSFFLVFFCVQSNGRYQTLYGYSMSCEGRTFDVASLCRATMPRANGLRLIRYMNATHLAGYVGLSSTYTFDNFFVHLNDSDKLLTAEEVKRMKEINMNVGGSCYRELVAWCIMEIETALNEDLIPLRTAVQIRESVLKLRGALGAIYDYDDQPISFFYIHFICLLSALYLPLFAISAAYDAGTGTDVYWTADLMGGLIVFLQSVFVIGLRLLGQKMIDPYGDDVEDLSVMHYINFTWRMSNRILLAQKPSPLNPIEETNICRTRLSVGEAWEDNENKSTNRELDDDDDYDGYESLVDDGRRCTIM